jgi:type II/III secretion system protein
MSRLPMPLVVLLALSISLACTANHRAVAQRGGRTEDERVAENRPSEQPKAMIALSVWILKLSASHEEADPELTATISAQTENLSPVIGTVSEVRELVARMRVAGLLGKERELRMVTVDGQPVTAQIGRNQPRIVGTSSDPRRGQVNSLKMEEIGVMIKAVPQIDSDEQIQVSLEIGESGFEKSTDVVIAMPAEGGPLFADVVTTRQFNTTARVKSGNAVLLQRDATRDSTDASRDTTELIILGAAVAEERD